MEPVDKMILLAARDDGLLITIDGVCHYKHMTSKQYFDLAQQCLKAGLSVQRWEEEVDAASYRIEGREGY
jgi:hypothetical protein